LIISKDLEIWGDTEQTRKVCFDAVQRAFRGTGELVNTKDLVYFNGSDIFWRYVENHIDEQDMLESFFRYVKIDNTIDADLKLAQEVFQENSASN
jgi:hypothetical protein